MFCLFGVFFFFKYTGTKAFSMLPFKSKCICIALNKLLAFIMIVVLPVPVVSVSKTTSCCNEKTLMTMTTQATYDDECLHSTCVAPALSPSVPLYQTSPRCLLLPTFSPRRQTGYEAKSIPCHLLLVIARLAVAPFVSPGLRQLQKYNEAWLLLAGCRMYILIRNKVLQLSGHFLLGYSDKLEL